MSGVALVQFSNVDLKTLLPLGREVFDRNLAGEADRQGYEPPLHHMLCIAGMRNPQAKTAEDARPFANLFHAGFIIACSDRDAAEILEVAGMPSIMVETVERGYVAIFLSGTVAQWREAVLRGCQPEVGRGTREVYNGVFTKFKSMGLAQMFNMKLKLRRRDNTFLLEHKFT
jgi:hypothetical protein